MAKLYDSLLTHSISLLNQNVIFCLSPPLVVFVTAPSPTPLRTEALAFLLINVPPFESRTFYRLCYHRHACANFARLYGSDADSTPSYYSDSYGGQVARRPDMFVGAEEGAAVLMRKSDRIDGLMTVAARLASKHADVTLTSCARQVARRPDTLVEGCRRRRDGCAGHVARHSDILVEVRRVPRGVVGYIERK